MKLTAEKLAVLVATDRGSRKAAKRQLHEWGLPSRGADLDAALALAKTHERGDWIAGEADRLYQIMQVYHARRLAHRAEDAAKAAGIIGA